MVATWPHGSWTESSALRGSPRYSWECIVITRFRGHSAHIYSSYNDLQSINSPFLEPFVRSYILGVGAGALLEGGHVALQVLAGSFPGVSQYSPLLVADHVTAFASWICLYAVEAVAILAVLKRFNWDAAAASKEIRGLTTLPKKMLPLRTRLFSTLKMSKTAAIEGSAVAAAGASVPASPTISPGTATTSTRANRVKGTSSIAPLPRRTPAPQKHEEDERSAQHAKRAKELRDRQGYLKNVWYAAAISDKVGNKPVEVKLCGKQMVLWREEQTGKVRCIDNACPHRGAPLSGGWVAEREDHSCIVCPYHGWALDGEGALHDVPVSTEEQLYRHGASLVDL